MVVRYIDSRRNLQFELIFEQVSVMNLRHSHVAKYLLGHVSNKNTLIIKTYDYILM